jgi:hypothetical protein
MTSDLSKLIDKFDPIVINKLRNHILEEDNIKEIRKLFNPNREDTGNWTGRCDYCHSKDLWDDVSAYGCNTCSAVYSQ